jgi:hypothetical protein
MVRRIQASDDPNQQGKVKCYFYIQCFSSKLERIVNQNYGRTRLFEARRSDMLEAHPLAAGLARAKEALPCDFTFFIGNRTFIIPTFQAVLLSPLAHRLLIADSTIDRLTLPAISADDAALFSNLLDFGSGGRLEIGDDNMEGLYRLSECLGNSEIAKQIFDFEFGREPLSLSNAIGRMVRKRHLGVEAKEEQELLASNFFKICLSDWANSTAEDLCLIVRRPSLRLLSEDSLVRVISGFCASSSRTELLGEVECEFLSQRGIDEYLNLISVSDIDESHWTSICRRLRRYVRPDLSGNRFVRKVLEHRGGADFDGILRHLKGQHNGNIQAAVSIEASSQEYGNCYDVTNYDSQSNWYTANIPNSWLRFDFGARRVSVDSYSMKSRINGAHIPRSWVLEGRNEDTDWVVIDRHENDNTIQGVFASHNFKCPARNDLDMFRFIQLRQTGLDSNNYNYLTMCHFELFGGLMNPGLQ